MSYSASEMVTEMGLRAYGSSFTKAMTPVTASPGRGWSSLVVEEPFTGAWQRNMELRIESTLTYPTLYACLDRISSDIGKLPYVLKREDEDGRWVEDRGNTAYTPVLRKPNRYQTAQQFREAWLLSKLIQGNTYVLKGRDSRGVVDRLWILDPCRVLPMISDSGDVFYQINYGVGANLLPEAYPAEQLIIPESEIIHDRMNCFHHQLIGVPPLCAANWAAVKNLKILQDSTTFFSNGANPGGILTAPAGMTEEDAQAVKDYWNSGFKGSNSGKVAVIGADMKFTPFAFKSADNQLVEQMQYSDQQITQPFGIPPFKVGIGTIPAGLKVSELNQLYYADALQRHIEAMENLLDEGLGIRRPQGVELDLEPLLRMDETAQSAVEVSLVSGEIKTTNEARKRFNLPPLTGGDTIYKQQQDFPLSEIANNKLASNEPTPAVDDPVVEDDYTEEEVRALSQENFKLKALAAARAEVFAHD